MNKRKRRTHELTSMSVGQRKSNNEILRGRTDLLSDLQLSDLYTGACPSRNAASKTNIRYCIRQKWAPAQLNRSQQRITDAAQEQPLEQPPVSRGHFPGHLFPGYGFRVINRVK